MAKTFTLTKPVRVLFKEQTKAVEELLKQVRQSAAALVTLQADLENIKIKSLADSDLNRYFNGPNSMGAYLEGLNHKLDEILGMQATIQGQVAGDMQNAHAHFMVKSGRKAEGKQLEESMAQDEAKADASTAAPKPAFPYPGAVGVGTTALDAFEHAIQSDAAASQASMGTTSSRVSSSGTSKVAKPKPKSSVKLLAGNLVAEPVPRKGSPLRSAAKNATKSKKK